MKLIKQKKVDADTLVKLYELPSGNFVVVDYFMEIEMERKGFITESGAIARFNYLTRNVHA